MSKENVPVQFVQVTTDQLGKLIEEKLNTRLEHLKSEILAKDANEELLTRKQAAKYLNVDISTLYLWMKKGKVTAYGIGNRRYFKRSELIECLNPIKNEGYEY